jgi:hypothetical protein
VIAAVRVALLRERRYFEGQLRDAAKFCLGAKSRSTYF